MQAALCVNGNPGTDFSPPAPYRPDELARIMSDLIERVFPNIGVLKLEDEKEIVRLVAVITDWVMNAYNDLLEEYPEKPGR